MVMLMVDTEPPEDSGVCGEGGCLSVRGVVCSQVEFSASSSSANAMVSMTTSGPGVVVVVVVVVVVAETKGGVRKRGKFDQ